MTEKLNTKHEANIFKTADLDEMQGMFTANRVIRSWSEDFHDEDTGEVVTIERNEIILERGVFLDPNALQTISFHLSAGDIKEVEVTNQERKGIFNENYNYSIWIVTAVIGGKKKNYFLYAKSVNMAFDIAVDFLEQITSAGFGVSAIKEHDSAYLLPEKEHEEEEYEHEEFYKIDLKIEHEENEFTETFILKTSDAEKGKQRIEAAITKRLIDQNRTPEFIATIISAKTIPCESIIDLDFCKKYIEVE